jgi:hypothetical protein
VYFHSTYKTNCGYVFDEVTGVVTPTGSGAIVAHDDQYFYMIYGGIVRMRR